MGKLNRLVGVPWHVEKMIRAEGDAKRHRARCVYCKAGKDRHCEIFNSRCRGAAHCNYYMEQKLNVNSKEEFIGKEKETIKEFEGVKSISITDVKIDSRFSSRSPKEYKVNEIMSFYKKHGELDKPIVVECDGNQYRLTDKYLRYVAAQRMGLTEIPAEFGTPDEIKQRDLLRKQGTLVWNNKNKDVGEITEVRLNQIKVKYDSGLVKTYDIYSCLKLGVIRPL